MSFLKKISEIHLKYNLSLIFMGSFLWFFLLAWAWPLAPGRDCYTYFYYYFDFWNPNPEDPFTMMFRTPLAPLFNFFLIDSLGPNLAEIMMGIFYAVICQIYFSIGMIWDRKIAYIFWGVLTLHFAFGSLFHVVSNDPVIAITFSLLSWATIQSAITLKNKYFFLTGFLAAVFYMARPGIFSLLGLLPLFLKKITWKEKALRMALFFLPLVPIMSLWSLRNYQRYGVFSPTIGADAVLPLARIMAVDGTLKTSNGPASAKLGKAIEDNLLRKDGEHEFASADQYFQGEKHYFSLMQDVDKIWGKGNYQILREAAWEAVRTHPFIFIKGVVKTFLHTMLGNFKNPVPLKNGAFVHTHKGRIAFEKNGVDQFPRMSEVNLAEIQRDPEFELVFKKRGESSYKAYLMEATMPKRNGNILVGTIYNYLAYLFPPILLWIFIGFFGFSRPISNTQMALFFLVFLALFTNIAGVMSLWVAVYQYRIPFDPIYVLFGLLGLFALRGKWLRQPLKQH